MTHLEPSPSERPAAGDAGAAGGDAQNSRITAGAPAAADGDLPITDTEPAPPSASTAGVSAPAPGCGPPVSPAVIANPWRDWRRHTPARLALGRAGAGMPTDETLRFGWAHAMARDAIHAALDVDGLEAGLRAQQWEVVRVQSRAGDRTTYLRRPDLGRQLDAGDAQRLRELAATAPAGGSGRAGVDVCIVIGDGLSSLAVERQAVPLLAALRRHLPEGTRCAPVVISTQARVALGDEAGEIFAARLLVMLIGERPGLSSPDSLGIYLTHDPKRGRHDAERNCISNVRPEGLGHELAAFKLAWLMREALRRGLTGVDLKDESDLAVLQPGAAPVGAGLPGPA